MSDNIRSDSIDLLCTKDDFIELMDDNAKQLEEIERLRAALQSIVGQTDDQFVDGVWREVNTTAQKALKRALYRDAVSTRQDLRKLAKDSAEWVRENADQIKQEQSSDE